MGFISVKGQVNHSNVKYLKIVFKYKGFLMVIIDLMCLEKARFCNVKMAIFK